MKVDNATLGRKNAVKFCRTSAVEYLLRADGRIADDPTLPHYSCDMAGTFDSVTSAPCGCGMLERLARDNRYPIVFDDVTGEYQLESGDGRWRHQMYHCPWCGGCLPSKRHTLFTEPDAAELAEVKGLLSHAKSLADVVHALGAPDQSTDCAGMEIPEAYPSNAASGKPQRSVHQYTARWTTLDVHVIEFDDGSIGCAISGKVKGSSCAPKGKRPLWPLRKRE